jgi:hypothetical protein
MKHGYGHYTYSGSLLAFLTFRGGEPTVIIKTANSTGLLIADHQSQFCKAILNDPEHCLYQDKSISGSL